MQMVCTNASECKYRSKYQLAAHSFVRLATAIMAAGREMVCKFMFLNACLQRRPYRRKNAKTRTIQNQNLDSFDFSLNLEHWDWCTKKIEVSSSPYWLCRQFLDENLLHNLKGMVPHKYGEWFLFFRNHICIRICIHKEGDRTWEWQTSN